MSEAIVRGEAAADSGLPRPRMPSVLAVLFAVYLALLVWIILWKVDVPFIGAGGLRHLKLVPFVASGEDAASNPLEVVANLLLFLPFGMYLGLLRPLWPWWMCAATVAGASVLLETAQYVLAIGASDTSDVIANTVGGIVGILTSVPWRRRSASGITLLKRICLVGTVLAVLACVAFFLSPLHYGPRDAPPGHVTQ